jgi:hypothetical protein
MRPAMQGECSFINLMRAAYCRNIEREIVAGKLIN